MLDLLTKTDCELAETNIFLRRAAIYWLLTVFVGIGGMAIMPNLSAQKSNLEQQSQQLQRSFGLISENNRLLKENYILLKTFRDEITQAKIHVENASNCQ